MRQVGILCAAALVAIQENIVKLEGDHENAKILAGKTSFPAIMFLPPHSNFSVLASSLQVQAYGYCIFSVSYLVGSCDF